MQGAAGCARSRVGAYSPLCSGSLCARSSPPLEQTCRCPSCRHFTPFSPLSVFWRERGPFLGVKLSESTNTTKRVDGGIKSRVEDCKCNQHYQQAYVSHQHCVHFRPAAKRKREDSASRTRTRTDEIKERLWRASQKHQDVFLVFHRED